MPTKEEVEEQLKVVKADLKEAEFQNRLLRVKLNQANDMLNTSISYLKG